MFKYSYLKLFMLAVAIAFGSAAPVKAEATQPIVVINRGIGGHNSQKVLGRFGRDVIDLKPSHVVLMVGTNDVVNSHALVGIDTYEQNVEQMLTQLRDAGVEHVVMVTLPPVVENLLLLRHKSHPNAGKLNEMLASYNAVIAKLAQEHGHDLVDFAAVASEFGGAAQTKESLIRNPNNGGRTDGVHLTTKGYRLLGQAIASTFEGKIKAGDRVVCIGDSLTFGYPLPNAGTALGGVYPAVLNDELNAMVGAPRDARAFAQPSKKPRGDNFILNGDFEDTDDALTPYAWQLWQHPGRYAGNVTLKSDQPQQGKRYIQVASEQGDVVAFLLSQRVELPDAAAAMELRLQTRGQGQFRVLVNQYDAKRKFIAPTPALNELAAWRDLSDDWQQTVLSYVRGDSAASVTIGVQIRGQADIDDVVLRPVSQTQATPAKDQRIATLSNDAITVSFHDPANGGGLRSIKHPTGWEFLKPSSQRPLWRIHLRRLPGKQHVDSDEWRTVNLTLDPEQDDGSQDKHATADGDADEWLILQANEVSAAQTDVQATDEQVVLRWQGIDLPGEPEALDVTVTAMLEQDDRFVRFRTAIDNRSATHTAFYVASPWVDGVYPADGDLEADRLASPVFNGRLIRNPIVNGILGKPRRFQPNRSGHSMQFDAYYHGKAGLYLGAFDKQQNAKRYELTADRMDGLGWAVVHIPDNMAQSPQRWQSPYDTVIACFEGDWYDASQLYRAWALQQSWASLGPISKRADLPQWFRDIDDWMMLPVTKPLADAQTPYVREMASRFSVGLWSTYWGKGHQFSQHSPDRFPLDERDQAYFALAEWLGSPIMAYLQAICWDTATESFEQRDGKAHGVRDFAGRSLIWNLSKKGQQEISLIAWPGALWTQLISDTVVQMAEAGMRGAYMDSFNHAGSYLNFNPNYAGDQWGGGNRYIKDAQKLLATAKARAREIDPGFVFTAESFWEGNMGVLDAYLTVNTTNQPLDGDRVTAIPLAHAVYHDHTIFYGGWIGRHDLQEADGQAYFAKVGQMFVWGVKSGWIQPTHLQTFDNHDLAAAEYPKRLQAYRESKDFLLYGRLLRQPRVIGDGPGQTSFAWYRGFSSASYNATLPVILQEAWQSPAGKLGIAFYNISAAPATFTIELTQADHGISLADVDAFEMLTPQLAEDSAAFTVKPKGDALLLTVTVPSRSPMVIAAR